jgi:GT2 family glycosyltransferase
MFFSLNSHILDLHSQKQNRLKPFVSIVILNYNGVKYLQQFLPSVMATQYENFEVVVADNGSKDDSLQFLQNHFPTVKIITSPTNEGFAGGYNWALKLIKADYYVLLNSDVEVTPNWIGPMVEVLEKDTLNAACQPKLLSQKEPALFEYAGAAGGWIDAFGYPFSRGRIFDVCEKDEKQYDSIEPIFWASGAAMMIRSSVFHELGGFDASFFAHQEEIDLCWRIQLAGYTIFCCPTAVVYHVGAGTLPRGGRKVFLNFRNNLVMLCKNLPFSELLWKLPFRLALDAISAWKGLLSGDGYFFTAIVKAHFAVFGRLITGQIKRSKATKSLKLLNGVYAESLVLQYFIKKKQHFKKIVH